MVLLKKNRIQGGLEVQKILKKGRSLNSESFQMRFLPNEVGFTRYAVIVSLRVSRKAAKRNKIKRRLSEIVRLNLSKTKPGYDIVLITKPSALDKNYRGLSDELTDSLIKVS